MKIEKLKQHIEDRINWLKQKEAAQRNVGGPEYTTSQLLIGRTQGNIGELERLLLEIKHIEEKEMSEKLEKSNV